MNTDTGAVSAADIDGERWATHARDVWVRNLRDINASGMTERCAISLLNERDALAAQNAELVEALKALLHEDGGSLAHSSPHEKCVAARAALSRATANNDTTQRTALARLIAAAPDMYEALQSIVNSVARCTSGDVCQMDDFTAARAALAKARGETA